MFRSIIALIGFALLLPTVVAGQSGDAVPPPLAYASMNTVTDEYHVLDFASGDITTIATTSDPYPEFGGEQFMPQEVILQSPDDETVQMVFTSADFIPEEEQYILYRVDANGERVQIADHALPATPIEWSPDGRIFYFAVYNLAPGSVGGNTILYSYDLHSNGNQLPLLERMGNASCDSESAWCVVRRWSEPDEYQNMEAYLLDTNTRALTLLAATTAASQVVWWQANTPTFIYAAKVSENRQALRLYNYHEHIDTLMAEFDGTHIHQILWSPDSRWLAVTNENDLYIVDMHEQQATPVLLSGDIDASVSTRYLRWMSDDTLFYEAATPQVGYEPTYGYYVTTVPDAHTTAVELNFVMGLVDDEWSPDGRWLALSFTNYGDENAAYIIDALGEAPLYQVEVDFDPGDMICVDWYDADVYATDITGLCDIYTGIG
jgi:hypothetical protein